MNDGVQFAELLMECDYGFNVINRVSSAQLRFQTQLTSDIFSNDNHSIFEKTIGYYHLQM